MTNKYETARKLFDNIIDLNGQFMEAKRNGDNYALQRKNTYIAFCKLLHHFNTNFEYPKSSEMFIDNGSGGLTRNHAIPNDQFDVDVAAFTSIENLTDKFENEPEQLPEMVFALMVVRQLLGVHKVYISPNFVYVVKGEEIVPWMVFANRFKGLIMIVNDIVR